MNQKFLKDFIKNCPITDFSTNGNIEDRERQLDAYIESLTSYIYPREKEFAQSFWDENFAQSQFINLSSYPLLRRCFIYYDVVEAVYNFVNAKYIRDRKATKSAEMLSVQIKNTFKLFTSILILILNGCLHSVVTEYRTLYFFPIKDEVCIDFKAGISKNYNFLNLTETFILENHEKRC